MKISELINELEKIKSKNGDIDVCIHSTYHQKEIKPISRITELSKSDVKSENGEMPIYTIGSKKYILLDCNPLWPSGASGNKSGSGRGNN